MDFANMNDQEFEALIAEQEATLMREAAAEPPQAGDPPTDPAGEPPAGGGPGAQPETGAEGPGVGNPSGEAGQQDPANPPGAPAVDPAMAADAEAFRRQQELQRQQQYANGIFQSFIKRGFDENQAQVMTEHALQIEEQQMNQAAQAYASATANASEKAWSQANPDWKPSVERLFALVGPSAAQALKMEAIQSGDYGGFLYSRSKQLGPTEEEVAARISEAATKAATEAVRKLAAGSAKTKEGHTSVNSLPGMPSGSSPAPKDPRHMSDSELAALELGVR